MTPRAKKQIRVALLSVAGLILVFQLLEMLEMIPRYIEPRYLVIAVILMAMVARFLRQGYQNQPGS
jgi:hypothetical protein